MLPLIRFMVKLIMLAILFPLRIFPVKNNRILLLNNILNFNATYSCNPKYLCEYILREYKDQFELIFPVGKDEDVTQLHEKGIIPVKLGSIKYYYYALTSKFFITTSGAIAYIPFRKKQVIINTWHGGGAYKKMALDTTNNFFFKMDCRLTEAKTTYFLSSNKYFTNIIKTGLLIPEEKVLEIGMPRNDVFFSDYKKVETKVKKIFDIPKDTRIVLYAPTYRTPGENAFMQHQLGPYEIDTKSVIDALENKFGGNWVFAIRLHPSIANLVNESTEGVINMSQYDDVQELLCAADILINDYSSIMWDFAQTWKPCFIFAKDIVEYESNLGLYTKPSSWPFPLAEDNQQLMHNISNFEERQYNTSLTHYFDWMENFETGQACEKLCKIIKKHAKK